MAQIDKIAVVNENVSAPITATSVNFMKVGTTTEATGVMHSLFGATGTPSAWTPATPGLSGAVLSGTTDTGCLKFPNATTGSNYLTNVLATATVANTFFLADHLWYNTGLVVTTTTAQTINSIAFPARDDTGTVDGKGVMVGILVRTATTNASAITNTTMSYTNQNGTSGRTATISSFPATAVAGTLVFFQLQAGDSGVQSIQTVTLGTSYGGGVISLTAVRIVAGCPVMIANAGGQIQTAQGVPGINVRLYDDVFLMPIYLPTVTTANTVFGVINVEEK